jgi:NAD(P)-dependent dehydrogenase (short-subunit alcohol dehydrogenase family)
MQVMASSPAVSALFDLSGRAAVVTGGSGVLGRAIVRGLRRAGANVAVLARHPEAVDEVVTASAPDPRVAGDIRDEGDICGEAAIARGTDIAGEIIPLVADVLDVESLEDARGAVIERWGRLDVLVNAAGGNQPEATVPVGGSFFDLDAEGFRSVLELNLMGTFLATQVFAKTMAGTGSGSVVNISSMAASRPLSRVVGYGAAKAGVENLTRWLADHIARQVSPGIRVNAVAPGFFLGDQNRALLTEADGSLTERGRTIVSRTPMGRLGSPEDLVGTVLWLASDASAFVTGTVVPVDGGFSAAAGI